MNVDDVESKMADAGYTINSKDRTGNEDGYLLRFTGGEVVNVFDSGRVSVQGRNAAEVKVVLGLDGTALQKNNKSRAAPPTRAPAPAASHRKVFVVYGHDKIARDQLEAMLRRWDYEPIILDQLASEGQTIIEKLEKYIDDEHVSFAVVLATPDDIGHAVGKDSEKKNRARQNVVLELGMLLAKLGRPRVAILLKDQSKMERPSDIQGLIYLSFLTDVAEVGLTLAKEMNKQGLQVDLAKL